MTNLKRLMALLLVVAMMTSAVTASTISITFTDEADIQYLEAVDVMVAISVINGYEDGSYTPDGDITRAEMAKLVSYILNSGEDINDDYAGYNTFYDCGSWHWASGYIAFAEMSGIICGDGKGYFDPENSVTGVEAAKMLLVALGYESEYEGYTGTGWEANVISDARKVGLNDDMTSLSWYTSLSRDEAAMMMFNALQATMIDYSGGNTSISTSDGTTISINGATSYSITTSNDNYDNSDDDDAYLQLCEEYFEDLKLYADSESDVLGRGAHVWKYDGDEIGTYADESEYTFFADDYIDPSNGDDSDDLLEMIQDLAEDDLEFYEDNLYEVDVYLNGDFVEKLSSDSDICEKGSTDLDWVEIQLGDVVEIYEEDNEIYKIVILRYIYDIIEEIDTDDDLDDCLIYTEEGYEMCDDDSLNFASIYSVADEGDDILLLVNDADDIIYAEWPTILSGEITSVYTDSYLKMDGTTYYLTAYAGDPDVTDDDDEAIIYLNQYGYVVYCDTTASNTADSAVAIVDVYYSINSDNKIVEMAEVVYSDGTTDDVEVGNVYNKGSYSGYTGSSLVIGGFYVYEEDDDAYDFTAAAYYNDVSGTLVYVDTVTTDYNDHDIFSSSSRYYFTDTALPSYYYYDDPYFMFIDTDDEDVTVYDGVTSYSIDKGDEVEVMVVLDEDRDSIIAVFVVGTADGETADDVVYIDGYRT
ncbi:MAG: S-layer homology domain-containing protein, partial [Eubacteriales bacterium]